MTLSLDVELTPEEVEELARTDPRWWFTRFRFANAVSPRHPASGRLEANNEFKRAFVQDWVGRLAPGARVLDTFCANGAFSFQAAELGATRVVGADFDPPRIECATMVAGMLAKHGWKTVPEFHVSDVYRLSETVEGPFDVVLCLGGLYHVSDPVWVVRQLREVTETGGHLLLQTSRVLSLPGQWARFTVRAEDRRGGGLSSHRVGQGVWQLTPGAVRGMLRAAGFEVIESRRPPAAKRHRFRWYGALARAT